MNKVIIIIFIFFFLNANLNSQVRGSSASIELHNGSILTGELVKIDSTILVIAKKESKTQFKNTNILLDTLFVKEINKAKINGRFNGATPIIISALSGGIVGGLIYDKKKENTLVSTLVGVIMGITTYFLLDKAVSLPDIEYTEIDKYPWKLKPYCRIKN